MKAKFILSLILLVFVGTAYAQVPDDDAPISTAPRIIVDDEASAAVVPASSDDSQAAAPAASQDPTVVFQIQGLEPDVIGYNEIMQLNGNPIHVNSLPAGVAEALRRNSEEFTSWSREWQYSNPDDPRFAPRFEEQESALQRLEGLVRRRQSDSSRSRCGWKFERGTAPLHQPRGAPSIPRGYKITYKCTR